MKRLIKLTIFFLLTVPILSSHWVNDVAMADSNFNKNRFIGDWKWIGGDGDPEISFREEDGKLIFNSWLHQRPSESGTWKMEKGKLIIKTQSFFYIFSEINIRGDFLALKGTMTHNNKKMDVIWKYKKQRNKQ